MTFDPNWAQDPQKMQQLWSQAWGQVLQSFEPVDVSALATSMRPLQTVALSPEKLARLQQQYLDDVHALWNQSWGVGGSTGGDARGDRRFASDEWGRNPLSAFAVAAYELQARTLMAMVDAVQADEKTRARIRFSVEQFLAASAPSNFLAFNVEAQKKALQTQGESLAQGLANLLKDIQQGHISMTDESRFEVGRNVATTEGAVVFENELLQLIEYKPLTAKVHERPFLMVPPCINKYYILDLQPDNSFIRYAVAQGHRTFVVSWRNPDMTLADKTWDDYIEGAVIKAIQAVKEISGAEKINALGFCVGGTMLSNALAVLAARGDESVASATFLTTLIDFTETGVLDVFIDENFVRLRELQMGQGGLMKGQDLASTFSFLRPNELYWNCDSTNLPGPYYAWYLRHFYLENKLVQPGALTVCGEKLDLRQVKLPVYVYGSREDHIVPIGGAYASTQLLPGKKRFVMGASGHNAGVINPPAKKKRSHWLREDGQFPAKVDDWIAGAAEHPGSWWEDWAAWLKGHAGRQVAAPKAYGKGARFKAIEPAPGRYVRQRA